MKFQPTLPMRGATSLDLQHCMHRNISTHAPHAGSDLQPELCMPRYSLFQPTLPMRGATSIASSKLWVSRKFQPTLPMRGATTTSIEPDTLLGVFQPTLPMRGATSLFSSRRA